MDDKIYPKSVIGNFIKENLLFKDAKLEKYYTRNEQRDLKKFRDRLQSKHGDKTFEKMIYAVVTDSCRDIILETISELTNILKPMGDLIISGGEAYNMYVPYEKRIVTSDIDAKFVPRIKMDSKYFGKLQAIKLILWNKMGELAKRLNSRVKNRISEMQKIHPKLFKFMGLSFKQSGPYVTRRYTLIKKKKTQKTNAPGKGDIFIDVELFALDLALRAFSPKSGRTEDFNVGGLLDVPFMRPDEFGYVVSFTKRKGITYRNVNTNKLIVNKDVFVASRDFLIEDIYLMQKLQLRPEKKEKDRQRLVRLSQLIDKNITSNMTMDQVIKKILPKIQKKKSMRFVYRNFSLNKAAQIDPYKYKNFTTTPKKDRLSKHFVHGLKPIHFNKNFPGYENTSPNQKFNLNTLKWKQVNDNTYIKNEFPLRPVKAKPLPKNININKTLYGYNPKRNQWVPKQVLTKAAAIPFIGLKK